MTSTGVSGSSMPVAGLIGVGKVGWRMGRRGGKDAVRRLHTLPTLVDSSHLLPNLSRTVNRPP